MPPRRYSTLYLILRYFVSFHFLEKVDMAPFLRRSPLERGSYRMCLFFFEIFLLELILP